MNYTKPDNEEWEDSPVDWLFSALVFARTIGYLLKDETGVVIDLKGDMFENMPPTWIIEDTKRVIVYNSGDQIKVISADERTDLKEGDIVHMVHNDLLKN